MTGFNTLANSRYTCKKYNPEKRVPSALINELKAVLRLSPSSINSQPWHFSFVTNQGLKAELAGNSWFNAEKIKDATCLVVFAVTDDIAFFEKHIAENLPEHALAYYNNRVKPLGEVQIKAWLAHQVYLSLGFFLGAAASLGIDSTPMEGIDTNAYDKILNTVGYKTLFAVALGYRADDDFNQPSLKPKSRLSPDLIIQTLS
ncbi:MAG: nitroreductase family protein [Mangrovibacterium sp.]